MEPRKARTASENDLTVRLKNAEEALRARETNFQLIIESIPALVAVLTPTGEVEALNQPVLDYVGESFDELTGWANSDVVHPDDLAPMTDPCEKPWKEVSLTKASLGFAGPMAFIVGSTCVASP